MKPCCNVATLIERYFTERLMRQRNVSANTIASYRDTFRLLFTFAQAQLRKPPSGLTLDDLDVPFISAFLADLETNRGASVRTRNLRLTARMLVPNSHPGAEKILARTKARPAAPIPAGGSCQLRLRTARRGQPHIRQLTDLGSFIFHRNIKHFCCFSLSPPFILIPPLIPALIPPPS